MHLVIPYTVYILRGRNNITFKVKSMNFAECNAQKESTVVPLFSSTSHLVSFKDRQFNFSNLLYLIKITKYFFLLEDFLQLLTNKLPFLFFMDLLAEVLFSVLIFELLLKVETLPAVRIIRQLRDLNPIPRAGNSLICSLLIHSFAHFTQIK